LIRLGKTTVYLLTDKQFTQSFEMSVFSIYL